MKRKELLKYLVSKGCIIEREGRKHTVIYCPITNLSTTVPRHKEINTFTGRNICRDLGIEIIQVR